MPKTINNKRQHRQKKHRAPAEGKTGMPSHMKKDGCIYLNGIISQGAHGIYHLELENGLPAVCTARKMESLKLSLLEGDEVVVEIPAMSLSPNETIKGRIIWRNKEQRT